MPALHQVKNSAVKGKQNLTVPPDGAVHLHPVEIQAVAVLHRAVQAAVVLHRAVQAAAVLHQTAEIQELIPTVPVTVRPPTVLFRKRLPVALMHSKYLVCPRKAYLKLMKEYHPDRLKAKGITGTLQREYENKCKLITEAYNYLKY